MRILDRITESKILWRLRALLPKLEELVKKDEEGGDEENSSMYFIDAGELSSSHNKEILDKCLPMFKEGKIPNIYVGMVGSTGIAYFSKIVGGNVTYGGNSGTEFDSLAFVTLTYNKEENTATPIFSAWYIQTDGVLHYVETPLNWSIYINRK